MREMKYTVALCLAAFFMTVFLLGCVAPFDEPSTVTIHEPSPWVTFDTEKKEPTEEPTEESTEEPTEESTEKSTEESTEEPTEEPTAPLPGMLDHLLAQNLLQQEEILTEKGSGTEFFALTASVGDLLARAGYAHLISEVLPLNNPDWYLFAVDETYGLYSMRTSGSVIGASVSFVALDTEPLLALLQGHTDRATDLTYALAAVAKSSGGGKHSAILSGYFADPASSGAYVIAEAYVEVLIARAEDGMVPAPSHYAECPADDLELARVTAALRYLDTLYEGLILWEGDRPAGIRIGDPEKPSDHEKQAVLALHTMNVTFCSFAAEIAAHAAGCDNALINLIYGYDRCKISDMVVQKYSSTAGTVARWDNDFGFYNLNSTGVKKQEKAHPKYAGEYA